MSVVYIVLIVAGLLFDGAAVFAVVHAVAEAVHPMPRRVPLVPFDAPEDEQPTLGVRLEVAQKAMAEARERALAEATPARGSVRVLDPCRAGWLFADRSPAGWSR